MRRAMLLAVVMADVAFAALALFVHEFLFSTSSGSSGGSGDTGEDRGCEEECEQGLLKPGLLRAAKHGAGPQQGD